MYIGKTWVICWTFGWILVMHVGKYTQVHSRSLSNQGLVWKCHTFQRKLTFINDKSFSRKNVEAPTLCISGAKNGFQWVSLLRRSLSYHIILQKEAGHEQATLTLKAKTTMEAIVLLAVLVSGEATSWINKIDVDHFSGSWFLRDPCGPGDWACTLFASSFYYVSLAALIVDTAATAVAAADSIPMFLLPNPIWSNTMSTVHGLVVASYVHAAAHEQVLPAAGNVPMLCATGHWDQVGGQISPWMV